MRRLAAVFSFIGFCMLWGATGCAGYQFGPVKPAAFRDVNEIAVPAFANDSLEPRLAVMVTNSVIGAFQTDGTYRITDRSKADAVLEGAITGINRQQTRSTRSDTLRARELEIEIELDYILRSVKDGRILEEGTVTGAVPTYLEANFQLSERHALPLAAERLARKLVSRISEGW